MNCTLTPTSVQNNRQRFKYAILLWLVLFFFCNYGANANKPHEKDSEPYRRSGDPASGVDEFIFWGWSADGRYYAFETFHYGSDMANCEGEAELSIVDAQHNRYAEDGHVLIVHKEAEAEVCDPPDLRKELSQRRDLQLSYFGISTEYIGGPFKLKTNRVNEELWTFAPPDGRPLDIFFRVLHGTDEPMEAIEGAAFELRMKQSSKSEVIIEPGHRRRPWTLNYGLDEGMVFVGPKGRYAAIMVAQRMTMPEGVRTTWLSSSAELR